MTILLTIESIHALKNPSQAMPEAHDGILSQLSHFILTPNNCSGLDILPFNPQKAMQDSRFRDFILGFEADGIKQGV